MTGTVQTIGVVVIQGNKVLLVKHKPKASHLTGTYGLPAGRLEEGEELVDGAARELLEEAGITAKTEDLEHLPHVFYADIPRKGGDTAHFKWDVFVAKQFSGDIKESEETTPEWIEIDKIANLNLLPNTEDAVREGLKILNS